MGKEKGYITQMIDKMKTTKVPMAEPDTMMDVFHAGANESNSL